MSTPVVDHRAPAGTGAHAGAAPLAARVLRQAGYETGTALRNGEQLLVTVVLPLLALVGVHVTGLLDAPGRSGLDVAVPGVLALAVISSAFTATAIATGFERRYDVLAALATTPLGTLGLVAGKALAVVALLLVQVSVIGGVGLALGWRPDPEGILPALVALVRDPSSNTVVESLDVVAGVLSVLLGVCVAHNGRRMRVIGWMSDTALITGAALVSVLTHTGTAPLLEGCVWAGGGRSLAYLPLVLPLVTAWWLWMSDPRRIVVAAERMDGLGASWNERHRSER